MAAGGRQDLTERFRRFAGATGLDLFEGALLVSELIDPSEDIAAARARVAKLGRSVEERRGRGEAPLDALRDVLFSKEGFRGDTESYDDPVNSSVARVLSSRRGLPITLSIVTLEVGRRAGLLLSGIGLPGHFVVGGPDLPEGTFLDPFDGGLLCDEEALSHRIGSLFGVEMDLPPEAFLPDAPQAILTRVLFNLRRSYERRDRFEEALAALEWAELLDPEEKGFLRERGLLLLKSGRSEEALSALESYVASGTGDDREAVGKLVAVVKEQASSVGAELVRPVEKRIFTLQEARSLLARVKELTSEAAFRYARLGEGGGEIEEERQRIVRGWAKEILALGCEIKGLWLVDFDSGAGYYCWKYPEPALDHFHGYEEGFAGRLPLQ
jgi:regulator of sirC expression with transglutaminase-like and TPR domain